MDNRKKILSTALQLFVDNGFHDTPTIKIARESGVANGTLFHYFKTKEELIVAVYWDVLEKMQEDLNVEKSKGQDYQSRFKKHFIEMLQWSLDKGGAYHFVKQFEMSPFFKLVSPEKLQEHLKPALQLIEDCIAANVMKPMPVNYIHALLNGQLMALRQYVLSPGFEANRRRQVEEETFELFWEMVTYRVLRFE